jgi:hypothetical protein
MSDGRSVESGIDAAEQNLQTGRNNIRHGFVGRLNQLLFSWSPGSVDVVFPSETKIF